MRTAKDRHSHVPHPTVVQTRGRQTGPLATRATQSAPVQRLQSLQRKATGQSGTPPIQRALSHNAAIAAADVATVTRLAAKVFELTGHDNERLIIKIETHAMGEKHAAFEARDIHTRDLAKTVLSGVPDGQQATPGDITTLKGLTAPAVGGDLQDLKDELNVDAEQQARMIVIKTAKVNVGQNVQAQLDEAGAEITEAAGARGLKRYNAKMAKTYATLTAAPMLHSMGKMAVFDILVNNHDRFRPEGTINLTNLDISETVALGIDNLNPYGGRLTRDPTDDFDTGEWIGGQYLMNDSAMGDYAEMIIAFLCETFAKDAAQEGHKAMFFQGGMVEAVRTLRAQKDRLRRVQKSEKQADRKEVVSELANRLKLLPKL